jgi:hypothetical protein
MDPCKEYELFLNQVNELTERRQDVTTAYLAVNTFILAALAFVIRDVLLQDWVHQLSAMALLSSGIIASSLWRSLLAQYGTLLGWWYAQLRALEEKIPKCHKVLIREYEELYSPKTNRPPMSLTSYQIRLTWLFTGIYIFFFMISTIILLNGLL